MSNLSNDRNSVFIELFSSNYTRIKSFILTLVPNTADADDIMQETSKILLEKFEDFEIGTNFLSWAFTIAKYQVLSYRRKNNTKAPLSQELMDRLAAESYEPMEKESGRLDALRGCINDLNSKDKQLLDFRFVKRKTAREVSSIVGVAMNTVYRNESRILTLLMRCIHRKLHISFE